MRFSLLTYNLMLNKAVSEIEKLILSYKPDVVCLQEINTSDDNLKKIEKLGYRLADYSNSFIRRGQIYGVTTFYNPKVFSLVESRSFSLPTNFYQIISFLMYRNRNPRTILKNEFLFKTYGKKITTYNIHLTPLATNSLRTRQIQNALEDLTLNNKTSPTIIAGDFNYPYGRRKFETLIRRYGLKEATRNVYFTLEKKILKKFFLKLKLDYVLYKNLLLIANNKILVYNSDHFPILSTFEL